MDVSMGTAGGPLSTATNVLGAKTDLPRHPCGNHGQEGAPLNFSGIDIGHPSDANARAISSGPPSISLQQTWYSMLLQRRLLIVAMAALPQ